MFTGLIRELATVKSFVGSNLTLRAKLKVKLGDSIAINGACLTVTKILQDGFCVELSPESQKHLALENYANEVHIEPAMMMGDRFEGHIVQGHIDAIGEVSAIKNLGNSYDVFIKVDKRHIAHIVPKGSISIDGVSLTVNDVGSDSFRLTIIPHTMNETLFKRYKKGTRVNVETDIFARYVGHIMQHRVKEKGLSFEEMESMSSFY